MTKIIAASNTTAYLPVKFTIFKNHAYGPNKGKIDKATIHSIKLMRCVIPGSIETVGDTIKRLKDMVGPNTHFHIEAAQETEGERLARYKRDGLMVVSTVDPVNGEEEEGTGPTVAAVASDLPITVPTKETRAPKAVDDDDVVVIRKKSRKVAKEAKAA